MSSLSSISAKQQEENDRFYAKHGIAMVIAWTGFGLISIISQRYLNQRYKLRQFLHTVSGMAILMLTTLSSKEAIDKIGGINENPHAIVGTIVFGLIFLTVFSGFVVLVFRNKCKYDWDTNAVLNKRKFHRTLGFFILALGQFATLTGLGTHAKGKYAYLFPLNAIVIIVVLGAFEYNHRRIWYQQVPYKKTNVKMTVEQFDKAVKEGAKLVILDDMVLDLDGYFCFHPGGKFVLRQNIGRDISKFFYGGYNLDGNLTSVDKPGYNHSNYARMIVNTQIVAQLEREPEVVKCKLDEKTQIFVDKNKLIKTLFLENIDGNNLDQIRPFYKELKYIGQHYLVRSMANPVIYRHFTIANIMNPQTYWQLIKKLTPHKDIDFKTESDQEHGGTVVLDTEPTNKVPFTIKIYDSQEKGLSFRFWEEPQTSIYEMTGPFGKGLQIDEKSAGVHIVFTAGTGILCFVDLIAHLALQNLGILNEIDGSEKLSDDFKLVVYTSYRSMNDAICLDLCKSLSEFNSTIGKNNFEVVVRLSSNGDGRWDENFIRREIAKHGDIRKMWVCGPPAMNESFDKTLSSLVKENLLDSSQFEVF